jgi:hypothetical protein
VLHQVEEISGAAPQAPDEREREQSQNVLAAQSPALDLRVEGSEAVLAHRNVDELRVNYYRMDIEFLFSANPFVAQDSNRFSIIKPNLSETRRLGGVASETRWSLPREFAGQNVLVEVVGGGLRRTQAVYSNAMEVQITEPYGRLQVSHAEDHRPLSKVYVKVYARNQDGTVSFYKDGYTDLRGRFDFTSVSTDDLERVQRFALLVLSDSDGAAVREAAPPQQ